MSFIPISDEELKGLKSQEYKKYKPISDEELKNLKSGLNPSPSKEIGRAHV